MSLTQCPVCASAERQALFAVESFPIHPMRLAHEADAANDCRPIEIVSCNGCGHVYNARFETELVNRLYTTPVATNAPVSRGMVQAVEGTARYILERAGKRPRILEIGGGAGAMAQSLATEADTVHLLEPSRSISPEQFAGSNIVLHQGLFPSAALEGMRFDVIVLRQVLEHVAEPAAFLAALRRNLDIGGVAYIEVPSGEYIAAAASVVDFHYPHVQYYRRPHIEALFARAGLTVSEIVEVKEGHDMGYMLRAAGPAPAAAPGAAALPAALAARLSAHRSRGAERLRKLGARVALYGANAYSQALLALYPEAENLAAMFDDTPSYVGREAYGRTVALPIRQPEADLLRGIDAIVITAYLHDVTIARKLAAFGFAGTVLSVRADQTAGQDGHPRSLFHD
jgi:SAM-dependent methyltransferase